MESVEIPVRQPSTPAVVKTATPAAVDGNIEAAQRYGLHGLYAEGACSP